MVLMDMGKYEGEELIDIIKKDANYVKWFIENFEPRNEFYKEVLELFEYVDENFKTKYVKTKKYNKLLVYDLSLDDIDDIETQISGIVNKGDLYYLSTSNI